MCQTWNATCHVLYPFGVVLSLDDNGVIIAAKSDNKVLDRIAFSGIRQYKETCKTMGKLLSKIEDGSDVILSKTQVPSCSWEMFDNGIFAVIWSYSAHIFEFKDADVRDAFVDTVRQRYVKYCQKRP